MDDARLKKNLQTTIYSDQLPQMELNGILDKDGFVCSGCDAKAIPCSYSATNLKRPYFRVDKHANDCFIKQYEEYAKKGKKQRIQTSDGFPVPYPSKLYLQDSNIKIETTDTELTDTKIYINTPLKNNEKVIRHDTHNHTSSTIRPIVRHFVDFPHDRDLPLILPMLSSGLKNYNQVFKKISKYNKTIEDFKKDYLELKIYYIPLSIQKNSIDFQNGEILLKLFLGDIDNEAFYLKIDSSKWSERKITEIKNELEDFADKKKVAYLSKENVYLFFVGRINAENPNLFELYNNDYRLYYAKFCKI